MYHIFKAAVKPKTQNIKTEPFYYIIIQIIFIIKVYFVL